MFSFTFKEGGRPVQTDVMEEVQLQTAGKQGVHETQIYFNPSNMSLDTCQDGHQSNYPPTLCERVRATVDGEAKER